MLLKDAHDAPDGLNVTHVNRWIGGIVRSAPARHVRYVTARWEALPNDAGRVSCDGEALPKRGMRFADPSATRIDVTEEMRTLLRDELARTGAERSTLFDGIDDCPNGLNPRIIRGWLNRESATTDEAYWLFVIAHLKGMPALSEPLSVPIRRPRKAKPDRSA